MTCRLVVVWVFAAACSAKVTPAPPIDPCGSTGCVTPRPFRVAMSISPYSEVMLGFTTYSDGLGNTATTLEELQRLYAAHGANEVYARLSTARVAPASGVDISLAAALEKARIAQALGLSFNPELGLFRSSGDFSCQTPPDFSAYPEITVPGAWETLTVAEMLPPLRAYGALVATELLATGARIDIWDIGNEIEFGFAGVTPQPLTGGCDADEGGPGWYRAPDAIDVAIGQESVGSLFQMSDDDRLAWLEQHVWPHEAQLLAAVAEGIRSVDTNARVATHLSGKRIRPPSQSAHDSPAFAVAFYAAMRAGGFAVDEAGLSLYPSVADDPDTTLDGFVRTAQAVRVAAGVPVFIAEYAYPAAPITSGVFMGWDRPIDGYPASAVGQAALLRDLVRWGATAGISGVRPAAPELGLDHQALAFFTAGPNPALARPVLDAIRDGLAAPDVAALPFPRPPRLVDLYPIDGVVDLAALSNVQQATVSFRDAAGTGSVVKSTNARWGFAQDNRNLYVAIEWSDDTNNTWDLTTGPVDFDAIDLLFDNAGDGTYDLGDDKRHLMAFSTSSMYRDQHRSTGSEDDQIGDGLAKFRYESTRQVYQAEFLVPLAADAQGEDANLIAATRYNFVLFDHFQMGLGTANAVGLFGMGNDASSWPRLPITAGKPHAYPKLPRLSGLMTFASDHEFANSEIYTFDPASGVVTRVTTEPTIFLKNQGSLSHDRTRVAFQGTFDTGDPNQFEIFVINVDGTNLTRLTNNTIFDAHPSWSPDDQRIVYASGRPDFTVIHSIVMTATGTEIADLTPPGVTDGDVEYLNDGRIAFITNRFGPAAEGHAAVMDEDGSNVVALNTTAGTNDYDAYGDPEATHVVFERFMRGTKYSTDATGFAVPWNIIENRTDGSGERTLLSDGFINTVPVYDPTGWYIAYIKIPTYTEVRLMTRDGRDLGRLIPDIARQITGVNWK